MNETRRNEKQVPPWTDPKAEPYIRIDNVTKKFGDFVAVNNVSLNVYKNELFCLLGGSGCGKSTLLRLLAGFEPLTAGALYIDGINMADIPPYHRPVNMMFQSYALFPHMSVEDNVAFGLKQDHLPRAEIARRVGDMLALVQLGAFAKRKPHQLSGGQRQRVALARALVKQPKLLLLDEPLGALDKKLREQTQFELVNIQERTGVTFMVVTHDQEEAMTLASRIGVMNQGQIVQVGTPTEIYEFPISRFVADFIGSVNMFEGRIVDEDNDFVRIGSEESGCTIFINHGVAAPPNATLWVAIRPEKIHVTREAPADARENCTRGLVQDIAYMGDISVFNVRLDSGKMVKVTQPNLIRHAEDRITWDDRVYLHWHPASGIVLIS
ncbi:MAG: ABC transporter ATP-binding protein [Chromatiales bacterium]